LRAAIAAVWAIIVCVAFLQAGNGLQNNLVSLGADKAFAAGITGITLAGYYVGYCLAPFTCRALIRRLGHGGCVLACMLVAAASAALQPYWLSAAAWTGLRFATGFSLSLAFVSVESWINAAVPNPLRGRIFSLYMFSQMAGLTAAQVLLGLGGSGAGPFLLAAALFLASAVPVAAAHRSVPSGVPPQPLSIVTLLRLSPLGAGATAVAGLAWAILFTFGPIYARRRGFDLAGIGLFMGLAMAAGATLQIPFGWLSDAIGRRPVMAAMFGGGMLAGVFGALGHGPFAALAAMTLAGGFSFPIYAIAVSHANDSIAAETRVAAAAGLILLFGTGSIFGPLLAGWSFAAFGPTAFFALFAAVMAAGMALALFTKNAPGGQGPG
jgi:MFS family permease